MGEDWGEDAVASCCGVDQAANTVEEAAVSGDDAVAEINIDLKDIDSATKNNIKIGMD